MDIAKNRKTPAVNGKGEKHSSDYSDDTAVRAVFEKFYESLRRIGVTMLKEGQADERARHGRTLVYRTYGETEYGTYFDVSDLRVADWPTFNGLLEVFGFSEGEVGDGI